MNQLWVVYVKSPDVETVLAFLNEKHAKEYMKTWGKYAMIIPIKKPETIIPDDVV